MQSFVQAFRERVRVAGLVGFLLAGCNPGAFDALASRGMDAGRGDAGQGRDGRTDESGAAVDGGSEAAVDGAADGGGGKSGTGGRAGGGSGGAGAGGAGAAGEAREAAGRGGAAAGSGGAAGGVAGAGAAGAGAAGGSGPAPCATATDIAKVTLSTSEVGEIAMPAWVQNRTVAASAFVRNRVLLVFGVPGAFGMAGWGSVQGLLSSPPHLEEQAPFVPLFESTAVAADRLPLTGSAVVDGSSALVYFGAATQFLAVEGAGVARLSLNGNSAEVLRAAGALFPPAGGGMEPWRPPFIHGAFAQTENDVDYIYVYGCQAKPNTPDEAAGGAHETPCRLARVVRTEASIGESYRYWSGKEWVADVSDAAIVIDHANGLSVSYNTFLGKYLAVNSGPLNAVIVRWADRLQGPWRPLAMFNTVTATGGFGSTFTAIELPALRDTCQRVTYVSYGTTTQSNFATAARYSTHLVRVELN